MTPVEGVNHRWPSPLRWTRRLILLAALAGVVTALATWGWQATGSRGAPRAVVRRGNLEVRLSTTGTLQPTRSITYRSPLAGRETEITFLAEEGLRIGEGDLIVRLDTVAVERDLQRTTQDLRQALVDLQVSEIELQEGEALLESLSEGEAALALDESKARLDAARRKVQRLREEESAMLPLLEQGFITRDELGRTSEELDQAEADLALIARRAEILADQTFPQDRRKAELQLTQKTAQRDNVRARVAELRAQVEQLSQDLEDASIYARSGGLVVHEDFLNASPRRKVRVGDRVTESQGLVTIPEVSRMQIEASVSEADVQQVRPGQGAVVVLEAFRDRRYLAHVSRVGTLAQDSTGPPFEGRRFELVLELDSADDDLRPDMTARVDVLLEERPDVLLIPLNAIFERNGLPVAHVAGPLGIETRPIRLGAAGELNVEVLEGLAEAEQVELTDVLDNAPTQASPTAVGGGALIPEGGGGGLTPR